MSLGITLLILLAAVMHAAWNALVKSSRDPLVELATLNLAGGIVSLPLLPLLGLPGLAVVPYLAGNVLCHTLYYTLLLNSYSAGGLSLVYPIARGVAPLLVAGASVAFLNEPIGLQALVAVALIAASIASLAFAGGRGGFRPRAVLLALATGASIAAYTLVDGAGARKANERDLLHRLPLRSRRLRAPSRGLPATARASRPSACAPTWKTGALSGVLAVSAYGIAVWAMTRAPIALVAALRETSVVVAAILGAVLLGEPFGKHRILASIGVAIGIVLLRLSS